MLPAGNPARTYGRCQRQSLLKPLVGARGSPWHCAPTGQAVSAFQGKSPQGSQQCGHLHTGKGCHWNVNKATLMKMTGETLRGDAVGNCLRQDINIGVRTKRKAKDSDLCLHQGNLHLGTLNESLQALQGALLRVVCGDTPRRISRPDLNPASSYVNRTAQPCFKERPIEVCLQSKKHCKRESPSWPLRQ